MCTSALNVARQSDADKWSTSRSNESAASTSVASSRSTSIAPWRQGRAATFTSTAIQKREDKIVSKFIEKPSAKEQIQTEEKWCRERRLPAVCWHAFHGVDCLAHLEGKCKDIHDLKSPDINWTPALIAFYEKRIYKHHSSKRRKDEKKSRASSSIVVPTPSSSGNFASVLSSSGHVSVMGVSII